MHHGLQSTQGRPAGHGVGDSGKKNMNPKEGTIKRRFPRKRKDNVIEEEEEEIGVHMLEKGGKLVMEVPRFKTRTGVGPYLLYMGCRRQVRLCLVVAAEIAMFHCRNAMSAHEIFDPRLRTFDHSTGLCWSKTWDASHTSDQKAKENGIP